MNKPGLNYKEAGVDIDAANQSVDMIKKWVGQTRRPEVMADIGSFGGFFALNTGKYREPVLVSGTDGVGTKLRISQMMNIHDTVGIDLVAMCVNDILVHGAEPLFFLDYIALGKLAPSLVEALVKGVSMGCLEAGCALIGGETAEMPGFYRENEYDLAGFAVGAVERNGLIDGHNIKDGDIVIGLSSSGIHSNGYSLVRRVLLERAGLQLDQYIDDLGKTLGEELLTPTRIYVKSIHAVLERTEIRGMAHITGGGINENLARVLPEGLGATIDKSSIFIKPVFNLIQKYGQVEMQEMFNTFNMGIGYIVVVPPGTVDLTMDILRSSGEAPAIIGKICPAIHEKVVVQW